jgi:hypothetical protein
MTILLAEEELWAGCLDQLDSRARPTDATISRILNSGPEGSLGTILNSNP